MNIFLTEKEEAELAELPEYLWTKGPSDVGLLGSIPPVQIKAKSSWRPRVKQYPLKPEALDGIEPVIKGLLKGGIIKKCSDSPCNTPIFPVQKANKKDWRMIQDLRSVNEAVQTRAPNVPDPHTLLNSLKPSNKFFTVIDLSNAFFSVPIHPDSQFWFAFTYRGQGYTYTRLPQGFAESPSIFCEAIMACLSDFQISEKSQLLIYVDDLLIASESEEACRADSLALLHHLSKTGNKVNKDKLQWVRQEVNYLGHTLSAEGKQIQKARKETISEAPKPETKKQMMSFLGLCNYCRAWIPHYAEKTQALQDLIHGTPMAMTDKIIWNPEAEKSFIELKQALMQATTLILPNYKKTFVQTVDCRNGFMTSVLLQSHGDKLKPLAFYSKRLDPVAQSLPDCVQAVCAAALAVNMSADIVLFHKMELLVPHAVDVLLLQSKMNLLSPARHLSYTAILLSQPHIVIKRCTILNPATLLPLPCDGTPHSCLEATEHLQLPRPDLQDTPLAMGEVWFVDGSCSKDPMGKNQTGYSVVALPNEIIEAERISSTHSAQAAELIALTRACELAEDKHLTVYTDSQYVFSTLFYFAKQWERRGMTTSTGKPVTHASLLKDLLQAIQLPTKLAVCKCAAHTKGQDEVSNGNRLADKIAKEAAAGKHGNGTFSAQTGGEQQLIDKAVLKDMQDNAPQVEKRMWITKGAQINDENIFEVNNKPVLPKSLFKAAAIVTHGRCHVSTGGMVTIIQQYFTTYGLNSYLKNFCTACPVCVKYNSQGNIRPKRGRFPKPSYPFQTMHMDFIELSQSGPYKYCLVMIDAFSKWVEIVPAKHADALTVAKAICKTISQHMVFHRTFRFSEALYENHPDS
ncbi:PREDICTED: uncharacterized protein LOC106903790 isoform X2 [Poecilia mexicana]|uniref:uncharacterized protein LOC106903790 isoform X2 n=1 Tax=Poecilia mexicana TaxID=48701 RepID=UPI00072E3502|nr:PREDICTED: uncharacterized protein LOC106903790 isoform X2 [Poecilia mexicana]